MRKVLWVAEIGSSHKGSPSLAYELIRQAAQAGASIAKFQFGWNAASQAAQGLTYNPVREVDGWAADLAKWCAYFDIELMASIWSEEGLEAARSVNMKRYKIAHQMRDADLIDAILNDGKQTFVSTSQAIFDESIYCVSKYPTYPADLNMPTGFARPYGFNGYSDHTHGIEACLLAVARGAQYIEKHFCLDKTDLVTKDTPFSATPSEFEQMVKIGNGIARLLHA